MRIVIATDSFKESLSSAEVAAALKRGLKKSLNGVEIDAIAVADGGEGTLEAYLMACGGKYIRCKVHDPLMRTIESCYGITDDGSTAVIEMAAASGISLLNHQERNPWYTSTFGTGELIKDALKKGCKTIIVGLGGSATCDAGTGMAKALGAFFTDQSGKPVPEGGGFLGSINRIDLSGVNRRIGYVTFIGACDVKNPLTGKQGAALTYSIQKGADPEMASRLDKNLVYFANMVKKELGIDLRQRDGTGAAGGLGAGMIAFLKAELQQGFEIISKVTGLEKKIRVADLVVTGEGKIDIQTGYGKTPYKVAELAGKYGKPVIAVCGSNELPANGSFKNPFDAIMPIVDKPMTLEEALTNASGLCEKAGNNIGDMLATGKKIADNL